MTENIYERHELEAYAGEHAEDYDLDAIEAEARKWNPETNRYEWCVNEAELIWLFAQHDRRYHQ